MFISRFVKWIRGGGFSDANGTQNSYPTIPVITGMRPVSADTALQISAVWSCVDLISKTLSSMPLVVYRQGKDGRREPARDSTLWRLLHDSPNSYMTALEFWRAMALDLVLRGNAYAQISRNTSGEAVALTPLAADQVQMQVDRDYSLNRVLISYEYQGADDAIHVFAPQNIFHVRGLGKGMIGLANLDFMRPSLSEAISMAENAASLFGNGNSPKGVLMVDRELDEIQRKKLAARYSGLQMYNESGLYILPADMKFQQVSLSPADAQLLESRKYSTTEICRWYGVPEALVNGDSANVDAAMTYFHKVTIRPLAENIEQAVTKRVLTDSQRKEYAIEFDLDAILRGSASQRYEVYARAVQNGIQSRNEVRRQENLPPVAGADELTAQNNLMPLDKLGNTDPSQVSQQPIGKETAQ